MEALLVRYGYALLFLGVAVEGEAFLLAGAFLAHRGILNLPLVILIAVVSNCTADQLYYGLARTRGYKWLEARFGEHPRYKGLMARMGRLADWLLLFSRYAFGFRILIPAICGALRMPVLRFSILNIIAGIIWAVPTALVGYFLGDAAEKILAGTQKYEIWVVSALLVAAVIIILVRHLRHAEWIEDLQVSDLHKLVPIFIGLMGVINLVSAMWPRSAAALQLVQSWLPLEVTQRSRPLMLFAGIALLQVMRNLSRRKELAWYVAVTALTVSLLTHITRGFDLQHSLVASLLLAYLLIYRRRYYARSDPGSLKAGFALAPVLAVTIFAYGHIGLKHRQEHFLWYAGATPTTEAIRSGILVIEPQVDPLTPQAGRFLGSLQIAGWMGRFYLLLMLLRPVVMRNRLEASPDAVSKVFDEHSRHGLSAFAVQSDKHHLLVSGGRGLAAYAVRGSVALSCGDPLSEDGDFELSVRDFLEHCHKNGWTPCIYEAAEERLPVYHGMGLRSLKMAEEAIVDLGGFSLAGGKRANVRAMVNKVQKSGMVVERYHRSPTPVPAYDEQLEEISQEWLAEKHMGEMGFTLGRFSLDSLAATPVFIARIGDRIEAFCTWLPYRKGTACMLDLMRKRSDAPAGTMDILIAHSLLSLKGSGVATASLANAPLANSAEPHGALERGVALLFENMNAFYGYKNLYMFKKKFAPTWEGRYLIYPKGADLPRVAYALTAVHSSGGLLQMIRR